MDLDQLHTFLEIVRLKSFSKAAETCFRTQPAISAQVRQLEQELNTSLFDRLRHAHRAYARREDFMRNTPSRSSTSGSARRTPSTNWSASPVAPF